MRRGLLFALGLALGLVLLPGADLYRWVDKDGRVHYSDVPPKGASPKQEPRVTRGDAPAAGGSSAPRASPSTAMQTLSLFLVLEGSPAGEPPYSLAIAVRVKDLQESDQVLALFENPADPGNPLAGSIKERQSSLRGEELLLISPPLAALECRSYGVTVTLQRAGEREPSAMVREAIASRIGCGK